MMRAAAITAALCAAPLCAADSPSAEDGLPPLTPTPGDPERGRAIVVDRDRGLCLLCHSGPFPEEPFQGNLGPSLDGVGSRLDPAALRLRIVDSRRINPDTIMPPYRSTDGLNRVGARWRGEPILSAQQVEDVVAFLATLTGGQR
jgi:L-cysteine S-thiosulfotransferase